MFQEKSPDSIHQRTSKMHHQTYQPMSPGMEVDFVVHSVYTKVKDLENKYIDLANYYKEAARGKGAKLTNKPTDRT